MEWTSNVEDLCERLRINAVNLSEYHRKRFYHFKSFSKYFRIPIIVLASISSTISVGLTPELGVSNTAVSGITCILGTIIAIMSSIELYLDIRSSMDRELAQSKAYYTLAIDIYRMLRLAAHERGEEGKAYLSKKYADYTKLRESSDLMKHKLKNDVLAKIPASVREHTPTPSLQDLEQGIYQALDRHHSTFFSNPNNYIPPKQEDSPVSSLNDEKIIC